MCHVLFRCLSSVVVIVPTRELSEQIADEIHGTDIPELGGRVVAGSFQNRLDLVEGYKVGMTLPGLRLLVPAHTIMHTPTMAGGEKHPR